MPATIKSITSKRNTVDVEIDGDPKAITVEYTTRKITGRVQQQINALLKAPDGEELEATAELLPMFVTAWNLAEDEGQPPIPLDKDVLMELVPLETLTAVFVAVMDDMTPKDQTDDSSNTP